jgi:hypothetical protein
MGVGLLITSSSETSSHSHKLNLRETPPSNWLVLAFSNEIESVEKVLYGDAVFIMPDQWREAVQEAEMGDSAGMKVSQQRQKTTRFDPDRPWSCFSNLSRQNVLHRTECVLADVFATIANVRGIMF